MKLTELIMSYFKAQNLKDVRVDYMEDLYPQYNCYVEERMRFGNSTCIRVYLNENIGMQFINDDIGFYEISYIEERIIVHSIRGNWYLVVYRNERLNEGF